MTVFTPISCWNDRRAAIPTVEESARTSACRSPETPTSFERPAASSMASISWSMTRPRPACDRSTSRASSSRPCPTSQQRARRHREHSDGERESGSAASPSIHRHEPKTPLNTKATRYATRIPMVTISWLKVVTPPRSRAGGLLGDVLHRHERGGADGNAGDEPDTDQEPRGERDRTEDRADDVDRAGGHLRGARDRCGPRSGRTAPRPRPHRAGGSRRSTAVRTLTRGGRS